MPAITLEEMRCAIEELLEARARAVAVLELTDPDDPSQPFLSATLPVPATPEAIGALTAVVGMLPPSYRHFLEIHDGLPSADMGADLFSAAQVLAFLDGEAAKVFPRIAQDIDKREAKQFVYFGASSERKNLFLFSTNEVDQYGEWAVIYHTNEDGLLDEYPNFLKFIRDLADTLRQTAAAYE